MTIDFPTSPGLRLRRADGRIVITDPVERPPAGGGRRALFLFFTRNIPESEGTQVAGTSRSRAECGIVLYGPGDRQPERALAVTSRYPDLEDPAGTLIWNDPPAGATGIEALFVPQFSDLLDLAARMAIEPGSSVAVRGEGVPLPLVSGPLIQHGAGTVRAEPPGATERTERYSLLFRPDARTIENYLPGVPDGSLIAIYNPDAGDSLYDFYPHVHRRGLRIVHGAATEGRALNDSEWRMARQALQEASIPRVRMPDRSGTGAVRPLDLPPACTAFILQIDL